eukprot:TRINITY_DN788_c0_g1_i1.p1 TRINITY_DN788_c0_g1~~TRINITY_DN788_c0_g1_i1.p1  ORF type:complete len:277 (+),score=57.98 TRINITY_DN788_c0_g1_i1:677-1507(+)
MFGFARDNYHALHYIYKHRKGEALNRRETVFLRRQGKDVKAFVPFVVIIILPFTPLLIPMYIKAFPHLLPSQFVDPDMKGEIFTQMYAAKDKATEQVKNYIQEVNASMNKSLMHNSHMQDHHTFAQFLDKIDGSDSVDPTEMIPHQKLFKNDFLLENLSDENLALLCQFFSISKSGTRDRVTERLNEMINFIRTDDKMIHQEGVESLSEDELEEACFIRGFCELDLKPETHRQILAKWIKLTQHPDLSNSFYAFNSVLMFRSHHNTLQIMARSKQQ